MYVNSIKEEQQLNEFLKSESKIAAVYGQKGMGKTTLIRYVTEGKNTIYFTAYDTSDIYQLALFQKSVDEYLQQTKTDQEEVFPKLEDILDQITEIAKEQELILVIDQYPAFVKADTKFEKQLYQYVSETWKDLSIHVIIAGEGYLFLEKHIYGKNALWKDMLGALIHMQGFGFYDSMKFYPEALWEETVFLYGITGGKPALLEKVNENVEESARRLYYSGECSAYHPEAILSADLRELSYYNCLLTILAKGHQRVNEISQLMGKPKDVVVPYLTTLINMGVVRKDTPITEETNRKKTRYTIVSSAFSFWYQCFVPNMNLFYKNQWEDLWYDEIADKLDEYLPLVFIKICREYLEKMADEGQMPFTIEQIGNWWKNNDESKTSEGFDIVIKGKHNEKDTMVFAKCFYDEERVTLTQLKEMIALAKQVHKGSDVYYMVFSKYGFEEDAKAIAAGIKNIMIFTLEDVCNNQE